MTDVICVPAAVWERFWAKVDTSGDCWLWTAACTTGGYGHFSTAGRLIYSHRLSYELLVGPIPPGLQIDHLCRVRRCVNPAHLEPVTSAVNTVRGNAGAMQRNQTECIHGHRFDEANTYLRADNGYRQCRECDRIKSRKRRQSKGADRG